MRPRIDSANLFPPQLFAGALEAGELSAADPSLAEVCMTPALPHEYPVQPHACLVKRDKITPNRTNRI